MNEYWLKYEASKDFDALINRLEQSGRSRELAVAITNLQTAKLWVGEHVRLTADKDEEE